MRFSFVHAQKASFPIAALCRLFEISRQGYYAYANRPASSRVVAEAKLCEAIREIFSMSGETYGSPRVLRELLARGIRTSKRACPKICVTCLETGTF